MKFDKFLSIGDRLSDKFAHVGAGALAAGVPFHVLSAAGLDYPYAFSVGVIACGVAAIFREWAGLKAGRPWSNLDIAATFVGGALALA